MAGPFDMEFDIVISPELVEQLRQRQEELSQHYTGNDDNEQDRWEHDEYARDVEELAYQEDMEGRYARQLEEWADADAQARNRLECGDSFCWDDDDMYWE